MKSLIIVLFLAGALLTGCSKNADAPAPATPTTTTFPQLLAPGVWTITAYSQAAEDKLKMLANTSINFTSDGKAVSTQNKDVTAGSWSWGMVRRPIPKQSR